MTRIRARCPECGEVELAPSDVVLHVVRTSEGIVGTGSSYRFGCPGCEDQVRKPANGRIAQLLVTGGVQVIESSPPPPHPESPPAGPPLTLEDLLELQLAMAAEDRLAVLAAERR